MRKQLLLLFFSVAAIAIAQPEVDWMRTYHHGGVRQEVFYDIYKVFNGGYAACGYSDGWTWIVRVDNAGELIWSNRYEGKSAQTIVETDEGDFITGRQVRDGNGDQIAALVVDDEGEVVWQNSYGVGYCYAIIELKDGAFLLAGSRGGNGLVVMIEHDGDEMWQRTYPQAGTFRGMRETAGGVVLCGYGRFDQDHYRFCAVKINFQGEVLWSQIYDRELGTTCYSMDSAPDNGFVLAGSIYGRNQRDIWEMAVIKIDDEGDVEWSGTYLHDEENWGERCNGICKIRDNGYALVGKLGLEQAHVAYRLNPNGAERWRRCFDFAEQQDYVARQNELESVIVGHDNSLIAAGAITHSNEQLGSDGMIIKLEPEILGPYFLSFTPEDTVFTTLLGDTVYFSVEARNQRGDELNYQWAINEEWLGERQDHTVIFDSLGVFAVFCVASDGEFTAMIRWRVTVDDFFIRSASPDSSDLTLRRNSTVPFSLDIACVEPDEPACHWTMIDRNLRRNPLGEGDSLDILFDLAGECAVEALVEWNGQREQVRWDVEVRSAVWWWNPHVDSLTVFQGDSREFNLVPFNQDSDSLVYEWMLDGESLGGDEALLELGFPELGDHALSAVCWDGSEADTVGWDIHVIERSGAPFAEANLPTEPTLYPAVPNPFNNSTRIDYYLVQAGRINLTLYDLSGRVVWRGMDGIDSAGRHTVVLDGSRLAPGVYVAALKGEGFVKREKVVMVR